MVNNIQKAHQIAFDYLIDYSNSFREEFDLYWVEYNIAEIYIFKKILYITNENLLYQFDGKIYWEVRGLTVRVASNLDLANLYGCFLKNKVLYQLKSR